MTAAVIASFFLGEFGEAAMVALLFKISLYLEDRAVGATRKSLNAITNIQPETAAVAGPDGQVTETPVSYTHLDVYKRQVWTQPLTLPLWRWSSGVFEICRRRCPSAGPRLTPFGKTHI